MRVSGIEIARCESKLTTSLRKDDPTQGQMSPGLKGLVTESLKKNQKMIGFGRSHTRSDVARPGRPGDGELVYINLIMKKT